MVSKNSKVEEQSKFGYDLPAEVAGEVVGFQKEQLSFPPYWEADIGKQFVAMVVDLDDRDAEFNRYTLQATHDVPAATGGKKSKEDVIVHKDEFFSMSVYAALPLSRYLGMRVHVKCTGSREIGQPQPMYTWELSVSEADKLLLNAERKEKVQRALDMHRQNKLNGGVKMGTLEGRKGAAASNQFPGDAA